MKYWAFISYSHRDESWARWLHRAIEAYRVPGRLVGKPSRSGVVPRRLFPVFRDRDELPTSPDLGGSIVDSLKQSRFLIVICSPEAASSRWVNEEVKTFKALGREDRVLCLVVAGEPNASDRPDSAQQECFPPAVRYRVSCEGLLGQERTEPLAADARPGKDGRSDVKLKLLSGLLGVGLDELKLREAERQRAGQWLSLMFAALLGALLLLPNGPIPPLRSFVFDTYQVVMPRTIESTPATVVEIDEKSLRELGGWPWPRTLLAKLVDDIAREQPAAIALDIMMPEADTHSAERELARAGAPDPALARRLAELPSNDTTLARSLSAAPSVLAVAGSAEPTGTPVRAPPFDIRDSAGRSAKLPAALQGAGYAGLQASLDELDRAAAGRGLISAQSADGVIRRIPLVAVINGTLVPVLAIEMLRVALHASSLRLLVSGNSVQGIAIGEAIVPTEEDGAVRIHYSPAFAGRMVSAIDVLGGKVDPSRLRQKLVLIGATAGGIDNAIIIPGGRRTPGIEIHCQLLENIFDGTLLARPAWARYIEASAFCFLAALFILGVPHWSATWSILALFACCTIVTIAGVSAYAWSRLLFDPAHVMLGIVLLYGIIMSYGFFSSSARLPDSSALEP